MVCKVNLESLQLLHVAISTFYFEYRQEILPVSQNTVITCSSSLRFYYALLVSDNKNKFSPMTTLLWTHHSSIFTMITVMDTYSSVRAIINVCLIPSAVNIIQEDRSNSTNKDVTTNVDCFCIYKLPIKASRKHVVIIRNSKLIFTSSIVYLSYPGSMGPGCPITLKIPVNEIHVYCVQSRTQHMSL